VFQSLCIASIFVYRLNRCVDEPLSQPAVLASLPDSEIADHCNLWAKQIIETNAVASELREKWNIYQCDLMLEKFPMVGYRSRRLGEEEVGSEAETPGIKAALAATAASPAAKAEFEKTSASAGDESATGEAATPGKQETAEKETAEKETADKVIGTISLSGFESLSAFDDAHQSAFAKAIASILGSGVDVDQVVITASLALRRLRSHSRRLATLQVTYVVTGLSPEAAASASSVLTTVGSHSAFASELSGAMVAQELPEYTGVVSGITAQVISGTSGTDANSNAESAHKIAEVGAAASEAQVAPSPADQPFTCKCKEGFLFNPESRTHCLHEATDPLGADSGGAF
jgi:hypothetical protein